MTASQCRDAGERSNVDDTAAPGGNHPSPRFLTHTKATIDEVSPGFFDVIQRDFFGFAENSFPRDISEKVQTAKFLIQLAEEGTDRIG